MVHFHIRWLSNGNAKYDWQAFNSSVEAQSRAAQLVQPDEAFEIEEFDGNCSLCNPVNQQTKVK